MELKSKDFENNGNIPSEFTCDGRNISPPIYWENVPEGTESFALTVIDPDAYGNWIHWFVYNISKEAREIKQGSLPEGAKEVENDFGKRSYGGPCPPSGTHRYVFTIYALTTKHLDSLRKHSFLEEVQKHSIANAVLTGLYKRRR